MLYTFDRVFPPPRGILSYGMDISRRRSPSARRPSFVSRSIGRLNRRTLTREDVGRCPEVDACAGEGERSARIRLSADSGVRFPPRGEAGIKGRPRSEARNKGDRRGSTWEEENRGRPPIDEKSVLAWAEGAAEGAAQPGVREGRFNTRTSQQLVLHQMVLHTAAIVLPSFSEYGCVVRRLDGAP